MPRRKDLLQVEEAADDILPFFVVNRFDRCTHGTGLLDFAVRIVKQDFSRRGAGEDLSADVRGGSPVKVAVVVPEETEHHDRSTHERLAEMLIGCAHDVDLQSRDRAGSLTAQTHPRSTTLPRMLKVPPFEE